MKQLLKVDILKGLEGKLDTDVFESCCCDILADKYPGLTPLPGHPDDGADGVIPDLNGGKPFPFIVTTEKNYKANLKKSLESNLNCGKYGKKCVFVTSQRVSPQKQHELREEAEKKGYQLLGIWERRGIADMLFNSSHWCERLLGISYSYPALSKVSKNSRNQRNVRIFGRDDSLNWLRNLKGDGIVCGQPGSGKTYLLTKFADESRTFFVVSNDKVEIIRGIKNEKPDVLIVDDAHINHDLIKELQHIRDTIEEEFVILAITWPYEVESIQIELHVSSKCILELGELSADEIARIVYSMGININIVARSIVEQSMGKPGLAVTLSSFALEQDLDEIMTGEHLRRSIGKFVKEQVVDGFIPILAAFSLNGKSGVQLSDAAVICGNPAAELQSILTKLELAGIVNDLGERKITVVPPILRAHFIKDAFYSGSKSLNITDALNVVGLTNGAIYAIMMSKQVGAAIDDRWLLEVLLTRNDMLLWKEYAGLGTREALYVYEGNKIDVFSHLWLFLRMIPVRVLYDSPILITENKESGVYRAIKQWIEVAFPGTKDSLNRRDKLFEYIFNCDLRGNSTGHLKELLKIAMSPNFDRHEMKAGSGNTFELSHGLIAIEDMELILDYWHKARTRTDILDFVLLMEIHGVWAFNHRLEKSMGRHGEKYNEVKMKIADAMVEYAVSQGERLKVWEISYQLDYAYEIEIDEDFKVIYSDARRRFDRENYKQNWIDPLHEIAERWSTEDSTRVVSRIVLFETEADKVEITRQRQMHIVCSRLAGIVSDCYPWLASLSSVGVKSEVIHPFALELAHLRDSRLPIILHEISKIELYVSEVAILILLFDLNDKELDLWVSEYLREQPNLFQRVMVHDNPRKEIVKELLENGSIKVKSILVDVIWMFKKEWLEYVEFNVKWEACFFESDLEDHVLEDIIEARPHMAYNWIVSRIKNNRHFQDSMARRQRRTILTHMCSHLSSDQVYEIFDLIDGANDWCCRDLINPLIGYNKERYAYVLAKKKLSKHWNAPFTRYEYDIMNDINDEINLGGVDQSTLEEMMIMALDCGINEHEVASSFFAKGYFGNVAEFQAAWIKWAKYFERLKNSNNSNVRKIAENGYEIAMVKYHEQKEEDEREKVGIYETEY